MFFFVFFLSFMFTSLMQTRFHSQHSFHVIFVCNAFRKTINSEICWYDFRCHRKNKIRTQSSQENSFTQIWLLIVCILADFWGFVAMLIRLSFMIRVVFFLYFKQFPPDETLPFLDVMWAEKIEFWWLPWTRHFGNINPPTSNVYLIHIGA